LMDADHRLRLSHAGVARARHFRWDKVAFRVARAIDERVSVSHRLNKASS
jgi:hypothetical protein